MGLRIVNVIDEEIAKAEKVIKNMDNYDEQGVLYSFSEREYKRYDSLANKVKVLKSLKTKLRKARLIL